jgi:hypothetical protein
MAYWVIVHRDNFIYLHLLKDWHLGTQEHFYLYTQRYEPLTAVVSTGVQTDEWRRCETWLRISVALFHDSDVTSHSFTWSVVVSTGVPTDEWRRCETWLRISVALCHDSDVTSHRFTWSLVVSTGVPNDEWRSCETWLRISGALC